MNLYKIEAGTGQHIGDRTEQQDRVALFSAPRAPGYMMAILADGMGGVEGGAMAAEQIILTAKQNFNEFSPLTHDVEGLLKTIVAESHTIIKMIGMTAKNDPHTTMVALVLTPEREAIWAHVGDSRLYRFRGPNFAEHTIDHSLVEALVARGELTREQAKNHRMSNYLVNGLGGQKDPYVTFGSFHDLQAGAYFLLCSDGLWHYFSDAELGAAIAMNTPREATEMLIGKARERAHGTGDNCSLAVVKLVDEKPPSDPEKTIRSGVRTRSLKRRTVRA
ncbi:MAG: protein phosphatase 2C domain-containing protein [Burkholderiaceae bacterium]|nr:protein phosphatase 2C domain-containing protein [Burkholderiaceae bacterium]